MAEADALGATGDPGPKNAGFSGALRVYPGTMCPAWTGQIDDAGVEVLDGDASAIGQRSIELPA